MKVIKERNPYLQRICSDVPHKYSFEMGSGKYKLLAEDGSERVINKTGTFNPKFRKNFSGFASSKDRYEMSKQDDTALHYTPNSVYVKSNSYYTPTTSKFVGYAQLPYSIKNRDLPQFLDNPKEPHLFRHHRSMKKSQSHSQQKQPRRHPESASMILQNATMTFVNTKTSDHYFQTSFMSMTDSKPLPKHTKKSCYNYRCKFMKHFVFDQKGKTQTSTNFSKITTSIEDKTLSKIFYDKQFERQKKQFSVIQSPA